MAKTSLITSLQKIVNPIYLKYINEYNFYIFGSILYKKEPNDIDLLIVYDQTKVDITEVIRLKHKLIRAINKTIKKKIDVCTLSYSEASQSNFIMEENCVALFESVLK